MDVTIACICPSAPHATDTVTLRDQLSFRQAVTLRQTLGSVYANDAKPSDAEVEAALLESYLLYCIERWSLVDEDGEELPPSRANIEEHLLSHITEAAIVGDAATALYFNKVVLPLVLGATKDTRPKSSRSGQTQPSTSARNGSSPTPPRSSSPSSTEPTQTDGTLTNLTPLAGGSSTSRKRGSAA